MKKFFLKPGFEFIFALSLMIILGLPPLLLAQAQKDLEIKIENGDTTVNGKSIKELSAQERMDALKDIHHLNNAVGDDGVKLKHRLFYKRKDTLGGKENYVEFKRRRPMGAGRIVVRDSVFEMRPDRHRTMDRNNNEMLPPIGPEDRGFDRQARMGVMRFKRKNTQNFNYVNIDNEGISTHISFHISEPIHEDLEKISGIEGAKLAIGDLSIVPEFSSGKTILMFTLPGKAVANVSLKDGEGKLVWSEKAAGSNFMKSFNLPLNGIYYLHIKQGNGMAVKKIVKEE